MSTTFYRVFLWLYGWGIRAVSPFNSKAKAWLSGRKQVFDHLRAFVGREKRPVIWFHCASLGEFEQARPLLEKIRQQHAGCAILLSFFSPSGYEVRKGYAGADHICYLPLDGPAVSAAFVELVKPKLVFWVKYEYWYYYLQAIHEHGIPLLLISGIFREGQPFFKWWGGLHRQMLQYFTVLFVQNAESKKLVGTIGLSANVVVTGDTRFDRVIEIAAASEELPLIKKFVSDAPVVVAGSTWEEDEEELDHFANTHTGIKFIIAPHEIDEQHLKDIEKLFRHTIRYSALSGDATTGLPANANVLIIDNIGMLSKLYRYARIAYVGGGFGDDGIHNVLEAAVYRKPVVFGPVYEKFAEAVDLVDAGGAYSIDNALELEATLLMLLQEEEVYQTAAAAAGDYVASNKGATAAIVQYIHENRLLTS